jgi:outer membrane protein assembly factor BamB
MKARIISLVIPLVFALVAALTLLAWVRWGGGRWENITARVPDASAMGPAPTCQQQQAGKLQSNTSSPSPAPVQTTGTTASAGSATVVDLPGAWPCFRGAHFDNISSESTPLAKSWGAQGPPKLWSIDLGEGYAGAAVLHGRVYVLDYDEQAQADALRCLSLASGQELWRRAYPDDVKRNHGMSRTVPAVTDKYVVTLGPKCVLMCTDAISGVVKWQDDLVKQFNTTVPPWYDGQCPLIDGDRVIVAPAGTALLVAMDLATGKVIWQTPNPRNWQMTHSTVMPVAYGGQRMYVYCASDGVVGVSAKDGSILWETTDWRVSTATIPTPVPVGDGKLFITGGYNSGAIMLQLTQDGGHIGVKTLFRLPANICSSDQQTPIFYQGHLYVVITGGQLVCLDLNGRQLWASGLGRRFGLGSYLLASGTLYLLNDTGTLTMVAATPTGYQQLAQAKVLDGHDSWGPMALAGGRLLVRDSTKMVCLDVKSKE